MIFGNIFSLNWTSISISRWSNLCMESSCMALFGSEMISS